MLNLSSLTRWIWIFSLSPWGKVNHLNTYQVCFLHLSDKSALAPEDDSPLFAATAPSSQAGHPHHPDATAPSSQAGRPPLPDETAPLSQAGRPLSLMQLLRRLRLVAHLSLTQLLRRLRLVTHLSLMPSSQAGRCCVCSHLPYIILYACVVTFL